MAYRQAVLWTKELSDETFVYRVVCHPDDQTTTKPLTFLREWFADGWRIRESISQDDGCIAFVVEKS